jgi:hypothetical protein
VTVPPIATGAPLIGEATFGPAIDTGVIFDGEWRGFSQEDVRLPELATRLPTERSPDVAFVHFGGVDEAGHGPASVGPDSAQSTSRRPCSVISASRRIQPDYSRGRALVDRVPLVQCRAQSAPGRAALSAGPRSR